MFERVRLWFFHRTSEPLLARIQSRFGPGPLKAAAIAEIEIAVAQRARLPAVEGRSIAHSITARVRHRAYASSRG
jgi:hypothetical protein